MRENPVKQKLAAGGRAFGSMIFEFFTPGMPRLLRNAGAEYALYCMEHTGASYETLKPQFALCRALGVVPLVRVPGTEYDFIARALDCGALGVMVPLVDDAEQARFIVSCTRYPPAGGRRGAAFGFAHDDYEGGDVAAKMTAIHERTLVIAMIETRHGLENVEAIAAVPGVDVLWLGHFDLSNFLGIPGDFANPVFSDGTVPVTVSCSPKSGSQFRVGTTTVSCSATHAAYAAPERFTCTTEVTVTDRPKLSNGGGM